MISPIRAMASALLMASAATVAAAQPACDRQCLEGVVDRYPDALVRHDPAAVPLAATAGPAQPWTWYSRDVTH